MTCRAVAVGAAGRVKAPAAHPLKRRPGWPVTEGDVHQHAGSPDLLASQPAGRADHVLPPTLLRFPLATLEPLAADEDGSVVDRSVDLITELVAAHLTDPTTSNPTEAPL